MASVRAEVYNNLSIMLEAGVPVRQCLRTAVSTARGELGKAWGEVGPTGAIPALSLEAKQETVIGLAAIDRDRCLPWAYDQPCIVCEEVCPVAEKAVSLEEVEVAGAAGELVFLQRPSVIKSLCIGCGTCEFQCPVGGEAAIRVYAPTDVLGPGGGWRPAEPQATVRLFDYFTMYYRPNI